jgi:hypothetical protein
MGGSLYEVLEEEVVRPFAELPQLVELAVHPEAHVQIDVGVLE